jgi:hypothetical protein
MGGVVTDAKDTIKLFAFADHAGIVRAIAEYSLKRLALADHTSSSAAEDTVPAFVIGPYYSRKAGAVTLASYSYIVGAMAENAMEILARADDTRDVVLSPCTPCPALQTPELRTRYQPVHSPLTPATSLSDDSPDNGLSI